MCYIYMYIYVIYMLYTCYILCYIYKYVYYVVCIYIYYNTHIYIYITMYIYIYIIIYIVLSKDFPQAPYSMAPPLRMHRADAIFQAAAGLRGHCST